MIFLWKITENGKLWLDGDPMKQIILRRLPAGFSCQEITFVGDKDLLNIYLSAQDDAGKDRCAAVAERLRSFFAAVGIDASVHWVHADKEAVERATPAPIYKKPLFWTALVGGIAAITNLGSAGTAWTIFFAAAAFCISWSVLTERGQDIVSGVIKSIKNGGR